VSSPPQAEFGPAHQKMLTVVLAQRHDQDTHTKAPGSLAYRPLGCEMQEMGSWGVSGVNSKRADGLKFDLLGRGATPRPEGFQTAPPQQ
jgi:hypothetical protein